MINQNKIRKIIREEIGYVFEQNSNSGRFYHGTSSKFPFQKFDKSLEGSGIVSSGGKNMADSFLPASLKMLNIIRNGLLPRF